MRRIALRLLLCLMLVLNGTGYAVAATQMQIAHMAMSIAAEEAQATPPCHESASSEAGLKTVHSHADSTASQAGSDVPECCQSSKCSCDYCLQHLTAAMSVVAVAGHAPEAGAIAQPRVVNRVAPPLPHLLRPPIG